MSQGCFKVILFKGVECRSVQRIVKSFNNMNFLAAIGVAQEVTLSLVRVFVRVFFLFFF